jgi:thiol-disulfide isomerase/thioredoxin
MHLMTALLAFASLAHRASAFAHDQAPVPATRVVEGRVRDSRGQPVRVGKVFFGPQDPRVPFEEESTASLDAKGRFRIELKGFTLGTDRIPASGPVRFLALSAGFRPGLGKVEAGAGSSAVEIRLSPEPWKETVFHFVDRRGGVVGNVDVDLFIVGQLLWDKLRSDRDGRCCVATPAGLSFSITARPKSLLAGSVGFRGIADDPADFTLPLYDPIHGRVVDHAGRPLSGIQIGRVIAPDYSANVPDNQRPLLMYEMKGSQEPAVTDQEGSFDLRPPVRLDSRSMDKSGTFRAPLETLCFADQALRHVAFLGVNLKDARPSYEVVLKPARRICIPLEHEVSTPSGRVESWWDLSYLTGQGGPEGCLRVMSGVVGPRSEAGEWLEAYWPEGSYRLTVNSADPIAEKNLEQTTTEIVVPPGDGPLTLPTLRMTARLGHRLIGQPAPEIEAKDLNTGRPVKLADFKGKVVVLDFWGYWCGPCIGSMPGLMKVHDQFKDRPMVFLAVHDQSIQTREDFDRKLAGVKRTVWDDRDLPFRVALDGPDPEVATGDPGIGRGVTCRRYQIEGFPTTIVIGPDGKVVGNVNAMEHGRLAAVLKEQLDKVPAR